MCLGTEGVEGGIGFERESRNASHGRGLAHDVVEGPGGFEIEMKGCAGAF